MKYIFTSLFLLTVFCLSVATVFSQENQATKNDRKSKRQTNGIGGREHDAEILGVRVGMSVPAALEAVFINANRKTGQERPDAQRKEGKDKKDIRVVYKDLLQGELQIVFAGGKFVREVALKYAKPPTIDDLRLPFTGFIGDGLVISADRPDFAINATDVGNTTRERGESYDGTRFDDRYSIGFTDIQKNQRIWWRDEKTPRDYRVRVQFFAPDKIKEAGAKFVVTAVRKLLYVTPGDEAAFARAFSTADK